MGKYLVTTNEELKERVSHVGYFIVETVREVVSCELVAGDLVIINAPGDEALHLAMSFKQLGAVEGLQLYYVADDCSPAIEVLTGDAGGYTIKDSYYIDEPDELENVTDEVEERGLMLLETEKETEALFSTLTNLTAVVAKVQDAGLSIVTERALSQLQEGYQLETAKREAIEQHFLQVIEDTNVWLTALADEKRKLEQMVLQVQEAQEAQKARTIGASALTFNFPQYVYRYSAPVVVFKEYSHTRYLTSFVLGFKKWLESKGKLIRLLIIDQPPGETQIHRYTDDIPIITRNTYRDALCLRESVGVVTEPFKEVLDYMCTRMDKVILVIDRMYRNDFFLQGVTNIYKYYAFSGISEYIRVSPNADATHCLLPIVGNSQWTTLRHINKYPREQAARVATHLTTYATQYQRMYDEFKHLI